MRRALEARARAVIDSPRATERRAPAADPPDENEPPDLGALYAVSDGIELADGTRILQRGEIAGATAWLVEERALEWDAGLLVIGERDDLVIIRDLDLACSRAGGGVIEAPTDGLSTLRRAALGVIGYLEARAGLIDPDPAPEQAAKGAVARGDAESIAAAIARGFYPGSDRELAHAATSLGALRARAGDAAGAMDAFEQAARARVRAVPRGAERGEAAAAWRASAIAAAKVGATEIAEACRQRAAAQ